jgi:YggT family protein
MQNALVFILITLLDLYVMTFFLRLAMAWFRTDFRNPLAQFVLKVTNPLVIPARRLVPAIGGLDTATLVVLLLVQTAATALLAQLACAGSGDFGHLVLAGLLRLAHLVLRTASFLVLIYVIASWVSPGGGYNPAIAMLSGLVDPLLRPLRRFIPPIGGFDLSPLFLIVALEALNIAIPSARQVGPLVCPAF